MTKEKRPYFAVFTKLGKDPEAFFDNESWAKEYCKLKKEVNIHTKFEIKKVFIHQI